MIIVVLLRPLFNPYKKVSTTIMFNFIYYGRQLFNPYKKVSTTIQKNEKTTFNIVVQSL